MYHYSNEGADWYKEIVQIVSSLVEFSFSNLVTGLGGTENLGFILENLCWLGVLMFVSRSIVGLKDFEWIDCQFLVFESIDCQFDWEFEILESIDSVWGFCTTNSKNLEIKLASLQQKLLTSCATTSSFEKICIKSRCEGVSY